MRDLNHLSLSLETESETIELVETETDTESLAILWLIPIKVFSYMVMVWKDFFIFSMEIHQYKGVPDDIHLIINRILTKLKKHMEQPLFSIPA